MKRLSYLLLAACFCLPVVGCGGGADSTPAPEASTPAATTEEGSDAKADAAGGSDAKESDSAAE